MKRQFDVIIERDGEGFYVASVLQLHGCHTQATSLDALMDRIREAIGLCLEVEDVPPGELEFIGIQRFTIAACSPDHRESTCRGAWPVKFEVVRVRDSHHFLRHDMIPRDCEISEDELRRLL